MKKAAVIVTETDVGGQEVKTGKDPGQGIESAGLDQEKGGEGNKE